MKLGRFECDDGTAVALAFCAMMVVALLLMFACGCSQPQHVAKTLIVSDCVPAADPDADLNHDGIVDGLIPESDDKGLMIGGERITVRRVAASGCASHTCRVWWAKDSLIDDCSFGPPTSSGKAALKFHAAQESRGGPLAAQAAERG